jgi:Methyltransferase domain
VTFWSVIEHVHEPAAVLDRIAALTERAGILALRVPDVRGLLPALALALHRGTFGRISGPLRVLYQLDWHYKHFTGFDRRTLVRAIENAGYAVLSVRREMSYSRRSLGLRMESIPLGRGASRVVLRAGLGAIAGLSSLLGLEDELVLIARKK